MVLSVFVPELFRRIYIYIYLSILTAVASSETQVVCVSPPITVLTMPLRLSEDPVVFVQPVCSVTIGLALSAAVQVLDGSCTSFSFVLVK